jgi:hypothetical protein
MLSVLINWVVLAGNAVSLVTGAGNVAVLPAMDTPPGEEVNVPLPLVVP